MPNGGSRRNVSISEVIPGTGPTDLGKAEDSVHTSGDTGVMSLGVGNEANVNFASDGDYIPIGVDKEGSTRMIGNRASGTADSGNPIKVGGKYSSTLPTLSNGQRGDLQLNPNGALLTAMIQAAGTSGSLSAPGVVAASVAGFSLVNVSIYGTYTGVTITFTVDYGGGSGFKAIPFQDVSALTTYPSTGFSPSNSTIYLLSANVLASTSFRVNVTAIASGTVNVYVGVTGDQPQQISPVVQGDATLLKATVVGTGTFATQATIAASSTNIAKAEDVASADADVGVPALAVRKATPANTSGTDGDYEFIQMANGRLWTRGIPTDANDAAFLSAANALNSTGAGLQASQVVAQFDDVSPTAITENQFGNMRMSANRNLYTTLRDSAGNERGANVTAGNALATDHTSVAGTAIVTGGTAGSQAVGGIVANNGTINSAVNPILVGGQAVSSENAAGTTAKLGQFVTDLVGKQIVLPYANPENFVSGAITSAMTGTTTTSLIAAPASGLRNYITQITVSCAHATQGTDIIIQDGSGGTTLYTIPAAAVYGGATLTFPTPLRQPTTATAIFCANVTTGSSTKVSASGYKGV